MLGNRLVCRCMSGTTGRVFTCGMRRGTWPIRRGEVCECLPSDWISLANFVNAHQDSPGRCFLAARFGEHGFPRIEVVRRNACRIISRSRSVEIRCKLDIDHTDQLAESLFARSKWE